MRNEELQQFKQELIQNLEETLPALSEVFQKYGLSPEAFQLEVNLTQKQASEEDFNKKETDIALREKAHIVSASATCHWEKGGSICTLTGP